jgi:sortase A
MLTLLSRLLLAVALVLGFDGLWIRGKALVAQHLLERAWREARAGASTPRPWPWADTTPVARIEAPRLGIVRTVLAGASGRTLAFAPGHLDGSALPGDDGNAIVAGHRDTSFRFLAELVAGDELVVERRSGERSVFQVERIGIFDAADPRARYDDGGAVLTLVTCYPFDAAVPGGRLRYVVRATAAT